VLYCRRLLIHFKVPPIVISLLIVARPNDPSR
jgi:hypothetical protein